jgi:hypothetical protein
MPSKTKGQLSDPQVRGMCGTLLFVLVLLVLGSIVLLLQILYTKHCGL